MAKLPDAGDLGNPNFRPARSFTNVPVADYQGAFGALGRGLSDIGEGAQRYAIAVDKRVKDEEAFGVNLRLADAQVQFSNTISGLDPSDPEFAQKRMKAWSDTFKPIMEGIKHGENRRRFGEWAYENGSKIQIESNRLALEANTGKTKLQIVQYMEAQKKLVADGVISPEVASANIKSQIAQAPYLFELDKQEILLKDAVEFDEAAVELVGASLIGNARKAPDSWRGYEGRLGLFLGAMQEAGYPLKVSSHYRTPEYQAKLYREKVDELRRRGVPNPEEAARKWVAAPGPDAPHANAASDLVFNGAKLGDKGTEAATKKAHELAKEFGLHFRMDHEPWHIEPVKDGSEPPPDVERRGQSELAVLSILEADPVFNRLPPDRQKKVLENTRLKYRQEFEEQEKLDLLEGTRAVVDALVSQYPKPEDRDKAFEELPQRIKDPEYLEKAQTMLVSSYAIFDDNEKANNNALYNETAKVVSDAVSKGNPKAAYEAITLSSLKEEDKAKLNEYVRSGGGQARTDDQWEVDRLTALSISKDPASRKKFLDENLERLLYERKLTSETVEKFRKEQEALKEGKSASKVLDETLPYLEPILGEMGLNITAKSSESDRAIKNRIVALYKRNIEAASTGGTLTKEQAQEIADMTLRQFRTEKPLSGLNPGNWFSSSSTYSETSNIKNVMETIAKKEQEIFDREASLPREQQTLQYPGQLYDKAYADIENGIARKRRVIEDEIGMARDDFQVNRLRARLKALDGLMIDGSLLDQWLRTEFPE